MATPDGPEQREAEREERYDAAQLQIELDELYADESRDDLTVEDLE